MNTELYTSMLADNHSMFALNVLDTARTITEDLRAKRITEVTELYKPPFDPKNQVSDEFRMAWNTFASEMAWQLARHYGPTFTFTTREVTPPGPIQGPRAIWVQYNPEAVKPQQPSATARKSSAPGYLFMVIVFIIVIAVILGVM